MLREGFSVYKGIYMNQLPNYKKHSGKKPANIHNNKGVDFCVQGHFDAGIAEFNKALQSNPDYPIAYFNRGIAFAMLRFEKSCMVDFETVRLLMQDFREQQKASEYDTELLNMIEEFFGISTR